MSAEVNRIEIDFAIPVEVSGDQMRRIDDLVQEIAKANEPPGHVHWAAGHGSKPMWADADIAAYPELQGGRSGAAKGEPEWDDSILYYSTACRERYPDTGEEP